MANFAEIPWIAEHIKLYQTDPEKARLWDSTPLGGPGVLPTLLLTTTGRKSGQPRPLPLIYGEAGNAYVVIASKGGLPNHPTWFHNLEANPRCEADGRRQEAQRPRAHRGRRRARAAVEADGGDLSAVRGVPDPSDAAGDSGGGVGSGVITTAARTRRRYSDPGSLVATAIEHHSQYIPSG